MSHDPTSSAGHQPIRVLVVGRRPVARAALRATLEAAGDLQVVGEVGDAERCRHLCSALVPDVLVGDLADPRTGGASLVRELVQRHPRLQALVHSTSVDGEDVRRVLDAGAVGYLLEDADPEVVREGVRAVARGESPLDPRAVRALLRIRPTVRVDELTAREREVLTLVMRGLANKQIARELRISDSTVKAHLGSIFARIGVADRTSAAVWAERNLPPVPPVPPVPPPTRRDGGTRSAGRTDGRVPVRRTEPPFDAAGGAAQPASA